MNSPKKHITMSKEAVIASGQAQNERNYWLQQLAGEWEQARFPYDQPRTGSHHTSLEKEEFTFTGPLFSRLVRMSGGVDPTLHMILIAGVMLLVNKYTGTRDIAAATPIDRQEIRGQFINTLLPLRIRLAKDITFKGLLLQVKDTITAAIKHQNYPVEVLMYDDLGLSSGDDSLFEVAILLENIQDRDYIRHINFSMVFSFLRTAETIAGRIEYDAALYHRTTIERIIGHLISLLEKALVHVDLMLPRIDILSDRERKQLLRDFNDTGADYPLDKTVQRLFQEQVRRTPDNLALKFIDRGLTYKALNQTANRMARLLRRYGVGTDQTVGILLNRSPQVIVAVMAVWKVGAAYIPLDTQYPAQRIKEILMDSGTQVLITRTSFVASENRSGLRVIALDEMQSEIAKEDTTDPGWNVDSDCLAYIIYTSGSTGKPKGVMVEQIGMMNHICIKIEALQMTKNTVVAQNAPYTFDISLWQFFAAQVVGGETVIYPGLVVLEPEKFLAGISEDCITILEVVPSYLSILLDTLEANPRELPSLKYLLVTGETVKLTLVRRWFEKYPGIKIVNAYGPTEASDDITHHMMDTPPQSEPIPIGKPLGNLTIYIVDQDLNLCPPGVKGEICVSGVGVGRGYLNRPELTAERFVEQLTGAGVLIKNFCGGPGGSFYKKRPLVAEGKKYTKPGISGGGSRMVPLNFLEEGITR